MSKNSSAEHGTVYQLRNLIGRSNVKVSPKNSMNESEDFLAVLINGYVTCAAMHILCMKSADEWPSSIPEDIWIQENDDRISVIMESLLSSIAERFINLQYHAPLPPPVKNSDQLFLYTKEFLTLASLYLEFADSIREGDGERVTRCWKYFAVIFHSSNRRNYAHEAVNLLYQLQYLSKLNRSCMAAL